MFFFNFPSAIPTTNATLEHPPGRGSGIGRHAAVQRWRSPAVISEDVAEIGSVSVDVRCPQQWQRQEAGCKGPGGREGQNGRPAGDAGRGGGRGAPTGAGQQADKLSSCFTPPSSQLDGKDNQSAPRGGARARGRCAHWPVGRHGAECGSLGAALVAPRLPSKIQRRDQSCVNGELGTSPQQQHIGDDILALHLDVRSRGRTLTATWAAVSRQTLAAGRSNAAFRSRKTRPWASSRVVATGITGAATPA